MPRRRIKPLKPALGLARAICEQYHEELHRFLMRRGSEPHTARDLAQEVYLRLLRVDNPELLKNPQGYMYRIASHVVYEYLLKQEEGVVTFSTEALEEIDSHPQEMPDDTLNTQLSVHRQLEAILDHLPQTHRAVFLLHKRDGWSYREVAQKLGLSVHTMKKYLFQALAQLREMRLQRSLLGEEWKP